MQPEIKIDLPNKRLQLQKWQYARHYYVVALPLLLLILIGESISITAIIYLLLSILFFLRQRKLLTFRAFKVNCTHEQLVIAMKRSAKSLDWEVEHTATILYAFDKERFDWRYNTGWLIVVAQTNDGFLFNSLSDPRKAAAPLLRPLFRLNKNTFLKHLTDVIQEKEYNENFKQFENEWTIKKISIRLFLYPLSLVIFLLLFYLISSEETVSPKAFISVIVSAIVVGVYLYSDIKSLRKNN